VDRSPVCGVKEPSPERPASVLQHCPHARFYLSRGAASLLDERKTETLARKVRQHSYTLSYSPLLSH
jgi:hypothetical protein